jgi:hypothetical protein
MRKERKLRDKGGHRKENGWKERSEEKRRGEERRGAGPGSSALDETPSLLSV